MIGWNISLKNDRVEGNSILDQELEQEEVIFLGQNFMPVDWNVDSESFDKLKLKVM